MQISEKDELSQMLVAGYLTKRLKQNEIAAKLGTSRAMVCRIVKHLQSDGMDFSILKKKGEISKPVEIHEISPKPPRSDPFIQPLTEELILSKLSFILSTSDDTSEILKAIQIAVPIMKEKKMLKIADGEGDEQINLDALKGDDFIV